MGGYPAAPNVVAESPQPASPPPPPPLLVNTPLPRIACPECAFTFIVGDIAVATCPNCGAEVRTGVNDLEEE
jgi:hypothetical protein